MAHEQLSYCNWWPRLHWIIFHETTRLYKENAYVYIYIFNSETPYSQPVWWNSCVVFITTHLKQTSPMNFRSFPPPSLWSSDCIAPCYRREVSPWPSWGGNIQETRCRCTSGFRRGKYGAFRSFHGFGVLSRSPIGSMGLEDLPIFLPHFLL